jgi:predicted amidophosphoribosyltransferase
MSVQQMVCTGCGAEANASCNCGKPYVPKKQRAAEAIAANPQKSNRAIAEEIGVAEGTVRAARATGAQDYAPEREGRDGKVW